jgi:hypothetical protein
MLPLRGLILLAAYTSVLHRKYRLISMLSAPAASPRSTIWCVISTYLVERNANPKPYKWKASDAEILSKLKRACAALDRAGA